MEKIIHIFCSANIIKWNNNEDNEFLINIKGNIVLFELTNDNNLKIISQSFFENLKKLNENDNEFNDENNDLDDSF